MSYATNVVYFRSTNVLLSDVYINVPDKILSCINVVSHKMICFLCETLGCDAQ